jgi:hypothetical protein
VRAPRYDEWPGSLAWPRARCERSTCDIYSAGLRGDVPALRQMGVDEIYLLGWNSEMLHDQSDEGPYLIQVYPL